MFLSGEVPGPSPYWELFNGVVTRILPGGRPGEATQTLAFSPDGLRPLIGAHALGSLELGPPLQLYADPAARDNGEPAAARRPYAPVEGPWGLTDPVWDPYSSAAYMRNGRALLRLSSDDTVTVVAGHVEERGHTDGPGRTARFGSARFGYPERGVVTDGAGSLYVADGCCIRRVQLPCAGGGEPSSQPRTVGMGGPAAVPTTVEGDVVVFTLPFRTPDRIVGLAFDGGSSSGSSSLIFAGCSAYRLPLGDPTAGPSLLAESEDADFKAIVLDGAGTIYTVTMEGFATSAVWRVAADGSMSSIVEDLDARLYHLAILPNGHLVACGDGPLWVLGLGLQLPAWHAAAAPLPPAAPAGTPPPRTLPADLRALLDRQPDGTADVTIVVGDRTFHAHRGLLCARSDYFQQLLGGEFVEGSAQQLALPEADADAFEVVLCWLYTDAADISTALAAGVAELADRLLLQELFQQATAVVEAKLSPATVVGLLLWAEARGPGFSRLLSRLKAWYLDNREAVLQEAEEEVKRLAECPGLMVELMRGLSLQPAKRPHAS
ncbi:Kelch-like protein 20 [Tetrabaena socialis]|uniref:Kelch-like protein 20 n=1 Tax=Tetrabaena socialis TaxID=47790 RepID=A0A2J7ZQU1_9CHLO|nr:Kelch-like protein 20 [Tetrabaena socialis]|eukprot:PNH02631.1 Kelch-like protein 20 [Tetrabaena socialis]